MAQVEADNRIILPPGRYVGAAEVQNDSASFAKTFEGLRDQLQVQFAEGRALEERIQRLLGEVEAND